MKPYRRALAAVLLCTPLLLGTHASAFSDTAAHWADQAITFVSQKGLMDGVSNLSFSPNTPTTRATLVTALYRIAGSPDISNTASSFSDVPDTASFAPAVRWAAANHIVSGVTASTFCPDSYVTREQLAVILYRFASLRGDPLPLDSTLSASSFADASNIRSYAAAAADWALQAGLMTGKPGNLFEPDGSATRAEIAAILERYTSSARLNLPDAAPSSHTETNSYRAFTTASGPVTRTDTIVNAADSTHTVYSYADSAKCIVDMGRVAAKTSLPANTIAQYTMTGTSGTIRWYDVSSNTWNAEPLSSGTKPKGMYYIRVGNAETILVTPQSYVSRDNGMIEYLPASDGLLTVSQTSDSFVLTLSAAPLTAGVYSDYLVLTSPNPLVNWNDSAALARWTNYRFTDANRWCLDGYYYTAPSSYFPYGENYFHNQPAAHIAGKMVRNSGDIASRALGLAMIDIMQEHQNQLGFIPSLAGSNWLQGDYHIGPNYYDTRFNTDFWVACLNAAANFGARDWIPAATAYGDFFVTFAQDHHYSFGSGTEEGWLVQDYWYPNCLPTHTSLNHHAAEAVFLYRLSSATGNNRYAALADRMVRGIEQTETLWILPDGNLNYSYGPDGTMTPGDYPDLTYNDLTELQRLYTELHGQQNDSLARLLASKRAWMIANGIL